MFFDIKSFPLCHLVVKMILLNKLVSVQESNLVSILAPQLFLFLISEGHRRVLLLLSCFLMWLCGLEPFAWSCSLWDIICLVWRHIYNHILQLRRDFSRMSQMLEKADHWETLNIKTPPWHTEMGSGFCNNRCDCRLHTKLYFQVPGGSEGKCQSLIKWVNIIVRQKKSRGFFFFLLGVF